VSDTETEFRKKDREYFDLIGRDVICRNQVLPILAFQWLRFGAGHLFTLGLPGGREMGAQRDEFYVPPTAEEIAMKLSLVRFSDEESDRMIELTMREAWPLADAVLALLTEPPR
jgi:hypothetical protein